MFDSHITDAQWYNLVYLGKDQGTYQNCRPAGCQEIQAFLWLRPVLFLHFFALFAYTLQTCRHRAGEHYWRAQGNS